MLIQSAIIGDHVYFIATGKGPQRNIVVEGNTFVNAWTSFREMVELQLDEQETLSGLARRDDIEQESMYDY